MMNNNFFEKITIVVFSFLGIGALIGTFWNPYQFGVFIMCLAVVLVCISEIQKNKK